MLLLLLLAGFSISTAAIDPDLTGVVSVGARDGALCYGNCGTSTTRLLEGG